MGAWDFNLQIPYQAPNLIAQGLAGLGQGVAQAIQTRKEAAAEAQNLQYEAVKNQTIVKNLFDNKMVTPEQYLEFQSAPPKKQKSLAEGYAASVTFNMMLKKNAAPPPLGVTSVPVPGGTPINVLGGGGMTPRPLPPPEAPLGVQSVPGPNGPVGVIGGGGMTPQLLPQPKPEPGPLGITRVQRPDGGTVDVIGGAGLNPTVLKKDDVSKQPMIDRISPALFEEASRNGYFVVPQSDGSVNWLKKKDFDAKTNPAVKTFDDTIGKTYGIKSADIFRINLTEPGAIKYKDVGGNELTTEEAVKLGPGAIAEVPAGVEEGNVRRIPLPEWNTIVNQWKALPRAGEVQAAPAVNAAGPSGGRTLSPQDQKFLDWALANPNDSRSKQIKERLGIP